MKYNLDFIHLFLYFLPIVISTEYIYRPMAKRTKNFGDDVCYYVDEETDYPFYAYVKPCEEGKKCVSLGTDFFDIYKCQDAYDEEYDNEGETCQTKDYSYLIGLDCTNYICNQDSKCKTTCLKNQVYDHINDKCLDNDPGYCKEYEFETDGTRKTNSPKNYFSNYGKKACAQIELEKTANQRTIYQIKKELTTYLASVEDGNYVKNGDSMYCKSGYALYFYGNGELKNPNTDYSNDEEMYLRCVTVLGRDKHNIIKYKIGDGEEKYYDLNVFSHNIRGLTLSDSISQHLMLKLELFKKFKERLDKLDCRGTGDCEDNELNKWRYFYYHPDDYLLYQNEPQVVEYLIQTEYKYKAEHTSPASSSLLNIKYLTLLSLLLLF